MLSETENKRQLLDLEFLGGILSDAGVETTLYPKSEQLPVSFLSIGLPELPQKRETFLQLMYIPTSGLLEETNILQFFIQLPNSDQQNTEAIASLLSVLNTRTALGYFGLGEDGHLFYRYNFVMHRFQVPEKLQFLEVTNLVIQVFLAYGLTVLEFHDGNISLEQAIGQLKGTA